MPTYKLTIEYEGSNFVGWQKQENGISIQSSIEESICNLTKENTNVFGAGRTDSGVHAKGQVAHFNIKKKFSNSTIRDGLNQYLRPKTISILKVESVNKDFHSRFNAKLRHYEYKIVNRRSPLTLNKNYAWIVYKKLNINKMKQAAKYFIGKNDYNAFRSINCQSSSSIKTIKNFKVDSKGEEILINVSAKSFLHSQVRIMVGTIVEVGKEKIEPLKIKEIIKNKKRKQAGPTAPAHGLYLLKVDY